MPFDGDDREWEREPKGRQDISIIRGMAWAWLALAYAISLVALIAVAD